ncbi:hypothetical protein BO71DRAFT_92655 [Aspergillus ellipticus CBS 707.79]|uniref:Uncharacterized protein n=1 Tax=Aspergillus ellipticus CBS 707.79 TaxID=1448320 RepID=A0A319CZD1_9EURO|nr:hypothetical protein BO71DRAFT_92655 [Aspergillus ellipticus CBS 707.79]
MVGWLMNDSGDNTIGKRRIYVLQDRHEIFLMFAEYDDRYLGYLKNEPSETEPPKTGPAKTENSKNKLSTEKAERASKIQTSTGKAPETEASETEAPSFPTIHQYAPWDTQQRSHIAELNPILLAIALYTKDKIQTNQKSSRK